MIFGTNIYIIHEQYEPGAIVAPRNGAHNGDIKGLVVSIHDELALISLQSISRYL